MGRKKKVKPLDMMLELGKRKNEQEDYLQFVEDNYKKYNTIEKAQALLWCINISKVEENTKLYVELFKHFKKYNFKNELTIKRLDNLEAFLWDNGLKGK